MIRRIIIAVCLVAVLGVPLVLPLTTLFANKSLAPWSERERIAGLAATTIELCLCTIAMALPVGVALAAALYRTNLPGRRLLRVVLSIGLFIPLPLFALAWQSVGGGWRPWTMGLLPAAFVHAMAALPWVVWLTGLGLSRVEPDLEEDARTVAADGVVLWRVSMKRAAPAIGLAAVWVALQAAGEITVTDLGMVRTFAEEVYTEFVTDSPEALGRAVAVGLPATVLTIVGVAFLVRRWSRPLTLTTSARPTLVVDLGHARWPLFAVVVIVVAIYAAVPLGSLIRQAGSGADWSAHRFSVECRRAATLHVPMLLDSILAAATAGAIAAGLALVASWMALDSRIIRGLLFALAIALWATPGPVLGFGLKSAIDRAMDCEDLLLAWTTARPFRALFYEQSTPLPVMWAHVTRLFPYAVAIVWPAVHAVPRDLREAARLDGATAWGEFRRVIWPATRPSFLVAALAVMALALSELAASKIVQVPGRQTFAQELFAQMHYAATATTAALALIQMVLVLGAWAIVSAVARPIRVGPSE
ncbi:MAG TPA: ABC transporter permease subunit [Gemmataceae bacterium]|nr:ABC transporter permease subunit [Gemmataceae bacterium]